MSESKRKDRADASPHISGSVTNGGRLDGTRPLQVIAERLPLGKLSASQTLNAIGDICGSLLCIWFLCTNSSGLLKFVLVLVVLLLIFTCVAVNHRSRR